MADEMTSDGESEPLPESYQFVNWHEHAVALMISLANMEEGFDKRSAEFFNQFFPKEGQQRGLRPDRGNENMETTMAFGFGLHEVLRRFNNSRFNRPEERLLPLEEVKAREEQYNRLVAIAKAEGLHHLRRWAKDNWHDFVRETYKSNPKPGEEKIKELEGLIKKETVKSYSSVREESVRVKEKVKVEKVWDEIGIRPKYELLPLEDSLFAESEMLRDVYRLTEKGRYSEARRAIEDGLERENVAIVKVPNESELETAGTAYDKLMERGTIFVDQNFSLLPQVVQLLELQHRYKSLFLRRKDLREDRESMFQLHRTDYDYLRCLLVSGYRDRHILEIVMKNADHGIRLILK